MGRQRDRERERQRDRDRWKDKEIDNNKDDSGTHYMNIYKDKQVDRMIKLDQRRERETREIDSLQSLKLTRICFKHWARAYP